MTTAQVAEYRVKAADRARRILDRGCVVLDTETTGLDGTARLVEITVIAADGRVLLDTLIHPGGPIPADATAIHGISDADVRDAPTLQAAWHRLMVAIAGRQVFAYNAEYDRRILAQHSGAYGLKLPPDPWECAMKLYSDYANLRRWVKLDAACQAVGVTLDGAHRAAADARATLALMRAMAGEAQ